MLRLFVLSIFTISVFFPWFAMGDAPELRLVKPDSKIVVGKEFNVLFEASWTPSEIAIQVLPPQFDSIKWGKVVYGHSRMELENSKMVYEQEIRIIPNEIGTFEFPPANVAYIESDEVSTPFDPHKKTEEGEVEVEKETEPEIARKTLTTEPFTVSVAEEASPFFRNALVGVLLVMSVFLFTVWRRRTGTSGMSSAQRNLNSPQAALHAARQYQLDHDCYPFFQALLKAVVLTGAHANSKELRSKLEKLIRKVGYQEYTPAEDELDSIFREVERLVKSSRD